MRKMQDLTGQKFGRLEVLNYIEKTYWECKCDCGNIKNVRAWHLTSGSTVSCGCKRKEFEDLTDKVFSRLTVLCYSHLDGTEHFWNCKCDCGKEVVVGGNWLRSKNTQSCGCLQSDITVERSTRHGLCVGKRHGIYNPEYEQYLRLRPQHKLRKTASKMAWYGLKKNRSSKRKKSMWSFLPYTVDELKVHLEELFEDWMSWDNYGSEWSIDHIIPQSKFSYTSMADKGFQDCWSLPNLRPLSVYKNLKKGDRLADDVV